MVLTDMSDGNRTDGTGGLEKICSPPIMGIKDVERLSSDSQVLSLNKLGSRERRKSESFQ